jgi:hypothetical protein
LTHYWHIIDTLLTQYWHIIDTLLTHYWHSIDALLTHYPLILIYCRVVLNRAQWKPAVSRKAESRSDMSSRIPPRESKANRKPIPNRKSKSIRSQRSQVGSQKCVRRELTRKSKSVRSQLGSQNYLASRKSKSVRNQLGSQKYQGS